jgi:hypothetical protein
MTHKRLTHMRWAVQLWVMLALGVAASIASAQDDPCAKFSWNVDKERALFGGTPLAIAAGHDAASAPRLEPDRLYQLQLAAAGQVTLALPPGKKPASDSSDAGLARLSLQQAGSYRISVDQSVWIDIVADGKMLDSADFQGRAGCLTPHKIVQYSLPAGHELLLQLSGAPGALVRLTITAAPSG